MLHSNREGNQKIDGQLDFEMMDETVDLKAKTQYYSQNPQYSAVKVMQVSKILQDNYSSFYREDSNIDSMKKEFYGKANPFPSVSKA